MDFRQAETRFLQLQENYQNGGISEEAFFQAAGKLMVQDDENRYWTIDPQTGGWLCYNGHSWQSASPPNMGATEKIKTVGKPRRSYSWITALLAGGFVVLGGLIILGLLIYRMWLAPSRPEVTILSPANGAQVLVGQNVSIESLNKAPKGISRVELWVDDELVVPETNILSGASVPLALNWIFQDIGSHEVKVKAYSAAGAVGESETITLNAVSTSEQNAATLVILQGSVEMRGNKEGNWYPAPSGSTVIQPGTTVRTSQDGRVQLVFSEEVVAELGTNTEMTLQTINLIEEASSLIRLELLFGDTWHRIGTEDTRLAYEIKTSNALITLNGALAHVIVIPEGETSLEVVEGEALMTTIEQTHQVQAGQRARVESESLSIVIEGPTPSAGVAATEMPICQYDATVTDDVTLPPGAVVEANQRIEKIWRIRNTGNCPWTDYNWTFLSGDLMGAQEIVPVPRTEPGGTVDISVLLEAPVTPGTYSSDWRLQDSQGQYVGQAAEVQIKVGK